MIRGYYLLTKPGIIMGNLITMAAGFALASRGSYNFWLFLVVLMGLGLVIASACVFNNYIDRELDKKMKRTKNRALALGTISCYNALFFASMLGLSGLTLLALYTNLLSVLIASAGFLVYVLCYSLWKPRSAYATLIGSIAGALPPVIGYTAVSDRLDAGALLLFAILVCWQMPHFFSIAMFRFDDYKSAEIPVLPVLRGNLVTKFRMLGYITAFLAAIVLLNRFGYTGNAYLFTATPLAAAWLGLCIKGFKVEDDRVWAKSMFRLSLLIITAVSFMISVDVV